MLTRAEEKLLIGLRRRRERERRGLFLAEGIRVVEALAGSALDIELAVVTEAIADTERGAALLAALDSKTSVRHVPEHVVSRVAATTTPQDVVVAARIPERAPDDLAPAEHSTVLVMDAVQDPGNFGTLTRSANAFGADAVFSLPGTVDAWNPKAVRAAAGSSFHVPILDTGAREALAWLRTHEYRILAADPRGEPVDRVTMHPRQALVVGNEGAGIGDAVGSAADAWIAVPIGGPAESLNVGVAAGILLYLLTRGC